MKKETKAILIGLVLGDGHLNSNSGVQLEISHCEKQLPYLEYKQNLLHSMLGGKKPKIHKRLNRQEYKISKGHRYFRILKKWIYKDKKKVFQLKFLNYLTPQAIALWWMDDGSLGHDARAYSFKLYTYTNETETQVIIDYFKNTWSISFYKIRTKLRNGEEQFYLQCRTKEGKKFSDLIRPHVIPSMLYKIL